MRVAIAELKQESNTFALTPTTLADFAAWHLWRGDEARANSADTNCEMAGFLDVLEPAGVDIVPVLATFAMSGGSVESATVRSLRDDLVAGLQSAGALDGVLLALHGAMVADDDDDPDGAILAAVRAAIGDVPLVVTLDLHANLTDRMVAMADAIVGFRTSPHIDQRDTGQRGAELLLRILRDGARPAMAAVKFPMVVPASTHMHHVPGPFKRLMDAAAESERSVPGMLAACVLTVQPWLDIDEMGFASVVVSDGDPALAERVARALAEQAWDEREAFMETELVPVDEAIRRSLARSSGVVVLSDLADGTGAGSPGDATAVIAALLAAAPDVPAYVCVRDPAAAREAIAAGVGSRVSIETGGKLDTVYNRPVRVEGEVTFAGPARFRFAGGGYTGVEMDMGDCAVVRAGQVHVLMLGNTVMTVDPAMYRAVGLEPGDARIVVVKSHIQFRAGYGTIADEIILLDSPGMSSDHLTDLPFRKISRPMFPWDRTMEPVFTVMRRSMTP
ncbi:MAG: M81 family metallopeptidase [Thermomicrobiales bacterium]